jgi:hypothetical protein
VLKKTIDCGHCAVSARDGILKQSERRLPAGLAHQLHSLRSGKPPAD